MSGAEQPGIQIDIVSDVMCPWCFVGKRRLEKALEEIGDEIDVKVDWKPYQLDATLPPEGKDRRQYLSDKFGGIDRAKSFYATIKQAGDGEGISFDFDAIAVSPNTLDAHRLIHWAGVAGHHRQDRVVEGLFKAYFEQGKNIGDHGILTEVATDAGMDPTQIAKKLKSADDVVETRQAVEGAHQMGVTGVPCFIVEQKYAISGAQEAATLVNAIKQIAAEKAAAA